MRTIPIVVIGILIALGVGTAFFTRNSMRRGDGDGAITSNASSGAQAIAQPNGQTPLRAPREAPAGQKEYRDEHYRFALFYPDDLTVKMYDEGGGASTITFQNPTAAHGFQIFVVPYAGTQISNAQFKKDVPSGVRRGAKDATIDGVLATSFYSSNALLGETAEAWFIKGGYLFEVTTLKPLDTWLANIMQSWIFI
ncbi:MAG: hypothetical protein AAB804_00810 [Patescibacteria group bacterium]